jgi:hypothetical protein
MAFSLPFNVNGSAEVASATLRYPAIRVFTVGQANNGANFSDAPMDDLQAVEAGWSAPTNASMGDRAAGGQFGQFSAVCWFFGRRVFDGLGGAVPVGLISNNWPGTTVETWSTPASLAACPATAAHPPRTLLWNAMLRPYAVGPMALTGFTWYQGESNTASDADSHGANDGPTHYGCRITAMVRAWRAAFQNPTAFFGFVQLATWCPNNVPTIPAMRVAQMQPFEQLAHVGFATNADHGEGCGIHPPKKQFVGARLGDSALAIAYGNQTLLWQSPQALSHSFGAGSAVVTVGPTSSQGLSDDTYPFNHHTSHGLFNCTARPCNNGTVCCAWGALQMSDGSWANATATVTAQDQVTLTLTAAAAAALPRAVLAAAPTAASYGWGAVPMMNVYDRATGLPLLPFNTSFVGCPDC